MKFWKIKFLPCFKLHLLILTVFCFEVKCFEIVKYEDVINFTNKTNLNLFLKNIKNNCQNANFIKNISNHKSYPKFGSKEDWQKICKKLKKKFPEKSEEFIEKNFMFATDFYSSGKLTGYYEPVIKISRVEKEPFIYPVLKYNNTLMKSRAEILGTYKSSDVIFWSDSNIDIFFLQIQGSGIGILPDGGKVKLSYAGNNGYEYTSIGKLLVSEKEIEGKKISLFSIKKWLKKNPKKIEKLFNRNKRYIFFREEAYTSKNTKGAYGKELVNNLSIAIDKTFYPYGAPFYLETDSHEYNLFTISHDTGSAIKGKNRADLFLGKGEKAEKIAGNLSKKLQLYILMPYNQTYD